MKKRIEFIQSMKSVWLTFEKRTLYSRFYLKKDTKTYHHYNRKQQQKQQQQQQQQLLLLHYHLLQLPLKNAVKRLKNTHQWNKQGTNNESPYNDKQEKH